jgi:hypothetical protein
MRPSLQPIILILIIASITIISTSNSNSLNHNNQTLEAKKSVDSILPITEKNKVINFQSRQIILTDSEIKEILGSGWEKIGEDNFAVENGSNAISLRYRKAAQVRYISIPEGWSVELRLIVSPSINDLDINYSFIKGKNDAIDAIIHIGDKGFVSVSNSSMGGILVFKRNNILCSLIFPGDVNIESGFDIAKKQDSKILKILSMIE